MLDVEQLSEPLFATQKAVGYYLLSLADTLSAMPSENQSALLEGIQARLALVTLRVEHMSGGDADSLRTLHDFFVRAIHEATNRRAEL